MQKIKTRHYRPTWAEIDLNAIKYNFGQIKRLTCGDTRMMVVVKANAYGHGIVEVSKTLASCDVDYLGVATMDRSEERRVGKEC